MNIVAIDEFNELVYFFYIHVGPYFSSALPNNVCATFKNINESCTGIHIENFYYKRKLISYYTLYCL